MSKNLSLKETGISYHKTFVYSDNPGKDLWNKVKKCSKIGLDWKKLISPFVYSLNTIMKI